jgi:hypothetical protein
MAGQGTADPRPTPLGVADQRTLPVAARPVLGGRKAGRHSADLGSARQRRSVTRLTRVAAASSGLRSRQKESTIASHGLAGVGSLRRARVTAKPSGRGASCGVSTEPGRRPAAWPEHPCAPLLACARTPPACSAPDWAHRFGSPVLPIKTPGLGHRPDSAGIPETTILVSLGRNKNISHDLGP